MTSLALKSLAAHSPRGFYLMVEGASIDKQAHESDADRTIWDTIEFDNAVQGGARLRARAPTATPIPANDTLVIVTADHESGGFGIIGVGNERYAPTAIGRSVRDYARRSASSRRRRSTSSPTTPSTRRASRPIPIRRRKLLHRLRRRARPLRELAVEPPGAGGHGGRSVRRRDRGGQPAARRPGADSDNRGVDGTRLSRASWCRASIENGATGCPARRRLPRRHARQSDGHRRPHRQRRAAVGRRARARWQFTGVYENTDVFLKLLRAAAGSYSARCRAESRRPMRVRYNHAPCDHAHDDLR